VKCSFIAGSDKVITLLPSYVVVSWLRRLFAWL